MVIAIVLIAIVFILILIGVGMYNGLVGARNQVKNAWAQIDVQLKRRHDLIPNLVETVKGYMEHERGTLEAVTNARNIAQSLGNAGVADRAKAEGELSGALSRLLAVAENYPTLKANENFLALQEELSSTENKISFSRQFYNDTVLKYNNMIQMFPTNIIAGMGNFQVSEFFEVKAAEERDVPKVSFPTAKTGSSPDNK
ncbi:MAG: LemA family protein [Chloroflexi bacterium]|nr:LemA family protein [Chloroflexota bacterium]